jgi:hypothetical protein
MPRSSTTTAPPDLTDLEAALAVDKGTSTHVLGISDTLLAVLLGLVALALFATGGMRKWIDRATR